MRPAGRSASAKPADATPSISTRKLKLEYGLSRWTGTVGNLPVDEPEIAVDREIVVDGAGAPLALRGAPRDRGRELQRLFAGEVRGAPVEEDRDRLMRR